MRTKIAALKEQRARKFEEMRDILTAAEGEDRDLNAEEKSNYDKLETAAGELEQRAARLEQMADLEPEGRRQVSPVPEKREDESDEEHEERVSLVGEGAG